MPASAPGAPSPTDLSALLAAAEGGGPPAWLMIGTGLLAGIGIGLVTVLLRGRGASGERGAASGPASDTASDTASGGRDEGDRP